MGGIDHPCLSVLTNCITRLTPTVALTNKICITSYNAEATSARTIEGPALTSALNASASRTRRKPQSPAPLTPTPVAGDGSRLRGTTTTHRRDNTRLWLGY